MTYNIVYYDEDGERISNIIFQEGSTLEDALFVAATDAPKDCCKVRVEPL